MSESVEVEIMVAGGGWLPLAPGSSLHTPIAFSARITPADPISPIVELDIERWRMGRYPAAHPPELSTILIRRRPGPSSPPLNATSARVPVARYMEEAIRAATEERGDADLEARAHWRNTRGRRITREQLEEVAAIYRESIDLRLPPGREIERRLGVARSTARRLVMQARAAGLLRPPSRPGVADEVPEPARQRNGSPAAGGTSEL
jgi:hypothetical protein